ncbi:hypothetical protein NKJ23_16010 [Mesorhizobium sp. M0184]|uniref:hypothetical protein n=1 Tax=Mesorhizobium sp. M0184 TaxID=2956906 RepID=UPI00333C4D4F
MTDPEAPAAPVAVSIKPMRLSDGQCDYFVSFEHGGREVTPHVFRDRFKAEYHVALYRWLFGQGDEPDIMEFDKDEWPARTYTEEENQAFAAVEAANEQLRTTIDEMWAQFDRLRDATNRRKCGQAFMVGGRSVAPWGIVDHAISALDLSMMRGDRIEDQQKEIDRLRDTLSKAQAAPATLSNPEAPAAPVGEDQIKHMVGRFLMWKLPEDFRPDHGISYTNPYPHIPTLPGPMGTNIFDAVQAEAMVRHMIDGMPAPTSAVDGDTILLKRVINPLFTFYRNCRYKVVNRTGYGFLLEDERGNRATVHESFIVDEAALIPVQS